MITVTMDPRAATTGIPLEASTPKEAAVQRAEMRIEGGGASPRAVLSQVKIA
jgi:hypothetical protein